MTALRIYHRHGKCIAWEMYSMGCYCTWHVCSFTHWWKKYRNWVQFDFFGERLANWINIQHKDDDGRCIVLALELNNYKAVKLIYVCFPCFVPDVNYSIKLGHNMEFIEDVLCDGNGVIIFGDMFAPKFLFYSTFWCS